jgi:hypothetical protein
MDALVTIGFTLAMLIGTWWGIGLLVLAAFIVAGAIVYAASR